VFCFYGIIFESDTEGDLWDDLELCVHSRELEDWLKFQCRMNSSIEFAFSKLQEELESSM
jgi:hypothetical protein